MRFLHRTGACVVALVFALGAFALTTSSPARAAMPHDVSGHVTIIVLDMSGSMSSTDPNGNRCSAANAYIDLSGPGSFIGVVGLDDPTGKTGGPHNFTQAAVWAQPSEMATVANRAALRQTIATKSNGCKPDGNTPTYDALSKAYAMLQSATAGGVSGSVILLTDGVPYPDTSSQVNAIRSDLVPQFKSKGWPVDTVALGPPGSQNGVDFHGFLGDIASATAGKFYDDGHGVVPGVSPLNLAPFFVDIFALRNGRTPGATIPPTGLGGGPTSRNFFVGSFVSHLDVIAVKDNPNTKITITDPNGKTTSISFVSNDPHYAIFSIDSPQSGQWQLNATGSGQFLMDSLVVSTLTLDITNPAKGKGEPLGQPVTITASLRDQGNAVVGQKFDVKAEVSFVGNGTATPFEVLLSDPNGTSDYTGTLTVPFSAPTGTYEVAVTARSGNQDAVAAQTTAQFEKFPTATLISPVTNQPTTDLITAHVVQWDAGLRFLYGSVIFFDSTIFGWHPSDWPLQGLAASPNALIDGEVLLGDQKYTDAQVTATEVPKTGATCSVAASGVKVDVVNDGNGNFRLLFPTGAKGSYCVTLKTTGTYKDSFGDLTTSSSPIAVTIGLPSLADELRAWAITALYIIGLLFVGIFGVYGPINYTVRPKPSGRARLVDLGAQRIARSRNDLDPGRPLKWGGWSLRRYFAPNRLPGGEVAVPNNLFFIFRYGNEVQVRVRKGKRRDPGAQWQLDARNLTAADGPETIVDRSRLSFSESGQKTDLQFEQAARGVNDIGTPASGDLRDRLSNVADKLPGRGPARRD